MYNLNSLCRMPYSVVAWLHESGRITPRLWNLYCYWRRRGATR
jgi:hypothetical protein